ncbi:hypothetical protein N0V86_002960 [Didymella sp. IMI 355093]|nr:hypothetical protein N0V86_002960 [Didymella sp. IMI 355093]
MARKLPMDRTVIRSEDDNQQVIEEASNRLPAPSKRLARPKDPIAPSNWKGKEPRSAEEMQDWLERERELILHSLRHWKARAEDDKTRARKEAHEAALRAEWAKWEPETDVETGEVYDDDRRETMLASMASVYNKTRESYGDSDASHEKYRKAQELWEDFLYYQNEWNRPRSLDENNERGPRSTYNPQLRTERQREKEKETPSYMKYLNWRDNLIRLYSTWRVGSRSEIPKSGIGPDKLHVYPDNIRHSTNGEPRRRVLEAQFPVSDLRLNHDAIAKKREEVQRQRKERETSERALVDRTRYAVVEKLRDDHELYHATTEHSTPWQYRGRRIHTSWESNDRPAVTSKRRIQGQERTCMRPRYRRVLVPRRVREETTILDKNNERQWDEDNRRWVRGIVEHMVWDEIWQLDENDQRIPLPGPHYVYDRPAYTPTDTMEQAHPLDKTYTSRKETWTKFFEPFREENNDHISEADENEYRDDVVPPPDAMSFASEASGQTIDPSDEDSDDEGDIFTRSYLGLPINTGTGTDPIDSDQNGTPSGRGPSTSPHGGGPSNKDDGNDSNDEDQGSDDNNNPKPSAGPKRRRFSAIPGEVFVQGQDGNGKCRWVTCTFTGSKNMTITQRDRVPAINLDAPREWKAPGKPYFRIFPDDAHIPVLRDNRYKGLEWKLEEDGLFHKDDLRWRPKIALREFHRDTGEYWGCSDLRKLLDRLIEERFSHHMVEKWNKRVKQYVNRNDEDAKRKVPKRPRWSPEEFEEAVRFLNRTVQRNGLAYLVDDWDTVLNNARACLDKYRTEMMHQTARGEESIKTKFRRAVGIQKKLDQIIEQKDAIAKADERPEKHFTVEDFKLVETENKSDTKRKATGEREEEVETAALDRESGQDTDDTPEREVINDHEVNDEDTHGDAPGAAEEPLRKRRKR